MRTCSLVEKRVTPRKSVRTSSQVDMSEDCPHDRDIINNDAGVERSTRAISGNQQASPRKCQKKSASGAKSKNNDNDDAGMERSNRALSGNEPA